MAPRSCPGSRRRCTRSSGWGCWRRRRAAVWPRSATRTVHVREGDGTLGWAEHAPYDAIVVTAGGPRVPEALLSQLASGGRLIMPVGSGSRHQRLVRVTRTDTQEYRYEDLEEVAFVPLIGAEGWTEGG